MSSVPIKDLVNLQDICDECYRVKVEVCLCPHVAKVEKARGYAPMGFSFDDDDIAVLLPPEDDRQAIDDGDVETVQCTKCNCYTKKYTLIYFAPVCYWCRGY